MGSVYGSMADDGLLCHEEEEEYDDVLIYNVSSLFITLRVINLAH